MELKKCALCYKPIEVGNLFPSQYKLRKYCGNTCAVIAVHKQQENRVIKECVECKSTFYIKASHKDKRKTCSRRCGSIQHGKKISGEQHPGWKEVKKKSNVFLYRRITISGFKQYEHRYIMEQHLGRKLGCNEVVHHINGNPVDNRLENLELMTRSEHMALHQKEGDL
jgi:endogenous inhibitor of DNA gyrase (YacG/DUF329 family)